MTHPEPTPESDVLREDEVFLAEYLDGRPGMTIDPQMVTPSTSGDSVAAEDEWIDTALNSVAVRKPRSPIRRLAATWIHMVFKGQGFNGEGIPLAGSELASAIGCSQSTAATALRALTSAGLLSRGLRRRGVPYTYWLRYPKPRTGYQLMFPNFRDDELKDLRDYLGTYRKIRTRRAFARRRSDTGLPICTATTLTAVVLEARSITEIAARTGATATTIRRHLNILTDHGLVTYDRALNHVHPAWGDDIFTALHQLTLIIKEA